VAVVVVVSGGEDETATDRWGKWFEELLLEATEAMTSRTVSAHGEEQRQNPGGRTRKSPRNRGESTGMTLGFVRTSLQGISGPWNFSTGPIRAVELSNFSTGQIRPVELFYRANQGQGRGTFLQFRTFLQGRSDP